MRILDREEKDIVPKIKSDWSVRALALTMVNALGKSRAKIPPYLALLAAAERARKRGVETAVFGMG